MKSFMTPILFILILAISILLNGCNIKEPISIENYFCDSINCLSKLADQIKSSQESVHCALYNANDQILELLKNEANYLDVRIIQNKLSADDPSFAREVNIRGLMHNKFCIFDGKIVFTGSFNPVRNNSFDDFLLIKNKEVAEKYENEFQELWTGNFAASADTDSEAENISISVYFCPEDDCAEKLSKELRNARKEIFFMTYSFTSSQIAVELALAGQRGARIMGIMDNSQISEYSKYNFLRENRIDVILDQKAELFHFKAFIIDDDTIATGSFNPTQNAQLNNKENLVIINNKRINLEYKKKFKSIWKDFKD